MGRNEMENGNEIEESNRENRITLLVLGIIFFVIGIAVFLSLNSGFDSNYKYEEIVSGVNVYSKIPFEDFQKINRFYLEKNPDDAGLICNFEISATSNINRLGYKVVIEDGEMGVYIDKNVAHIRGNNDGEKLRACRAFICLNKGINCTENIEQIRDLIIRKRVANVIIGENISGAGLRGYGEILGALGYLQASNIRDLNGDRTINKSEIKETLIVILPYIQNGSICNLQPITTHFQRYNQTNMSVDCYIVTPSIRLVKSKRNAIRFYDNDLILEGDDEHLNIESIIVRDAIAPELILKIYDMI
ncbi:MAG TPA: hypothetical protein ENF49_03555 [Candidatus Altiarchaeales archaeon]|nr:hypothetical protein [Candidatus Altiarchaeales archaeon]HEX55185.1 hypothetical protein [Candidatus Altiarchaeales archaeon]